MKLPENIDNSMVVMGLVAPGIALDAEPLTGGVASDIWRVRLPEGDICVKQAPEQLKVTQEWHVPVDRNAYEVAWFKTVARIVPEAVPRILGHDSKAGVFAMEYLPPNEFKVWKSLLREGQASTATAGSVAKILLATHAATAFDRHVAKQFATDDLFFALRTGPYLLATAKRHPDVAQQLSPLADRLMAEKKALVHGDVSPKNILVGVKELWGWMPATRY